MDRQAPVAGSDEIDLYVRTYYSLLRSSGEVRVRAFEEAHLYSNSSLHLGALDPRPDVAAFAYSAGRLPSCMPELERLVLGQSHEHFEAAGLPVMEWRRVRTRGRRRPLRWDGATTLAAFVTSTSDIDDLVPIVTAYQVEWNKLHRCIVESALGPTIAEKGAAAFDDSDGRERLSAALGVDAAGLDTLRAAFGDGWDAGLRAFSRGELDLSMRLLNGSYAQYQRAAQRWWGAIEPSYLRAAPPRRRPVYFVSSNAHAFSNLLGGYPRLHLDEIVAFARRLNPEDLARPLEQAIARGDGEAVANLSYYLMRKYLFEERADAAGESRLDDAQRCDAESGLLNIESPGKIDVGAQIIELDKLREERFDERLRMPGLSSLSRSDAVIINIDYPLGMAAYHHLSRVAQGIGELRGIYVMGKAATLNGRVGDVMIPTVAHDEHSRNTFLFRNCFAAADVQPYVRAASVFDNQKALTVRSAFLQNRHYMSVFYREGYTVIEMEASPYLCAIYEIVSPNRYPQDEIVHLSNLVPFDVGILHYASDTPYSRRQSLLSKSLSFFGVDSTYGCAIAILRRIFERELSRV